MSAEADLRTALLAAAAVAALVGERVSAERAEQGEPFPFVVFTRTATEPFGDIDGAVHASLVSIDVQCWATTRAGADALADAVSTVVRAVPTQSVVGRSAGYDPDLDCDVAVLNVAWWELPS